VLLKLLPAGPNATVFAYAAAQVKKAMEVTQLLGGENYVFWGGREGYQSLLNTDLELEMDNLGRWVSSFYCYLLHYKGFAAGWRGLRVLGRA
jgi:xylose isomerase